MTHLDKNTSAYGLSDSQLMHIEQVESGLSCNCNCIACGDRLVAKKGEVKKHHFAHHSMDAGDCRESTLHKICKHILDMERRVVTPEFTVVCSQLDMAQIEHTESEIIAAQDVHFCEIALEQPEADFIPDVTAIEFEGQTLFIEIVVTNDVSQEKLKRVERLGIPMMAIYVNELDIMDDLDKLTKSVIEQAPRKWVYHPAITQIEARLKSDLDFDISLINERMRLAVLEEQAQSGCAQGITLKQGQTLILGFNSAYGYSRKKGRNFDFSALFVTKPLRSSCTANYIVRANGGHEPETVYFDESLLPQLSQMTFPCIVELGLKPVLMGGRAVTVVDAITAC